MPFVELQMTDVDFETRITTLEENSGTYPINGKETEEIVKVHSQ